MKRKLQPNFDIIRLYPEAEPPPVIKVGILPFISKEGTPGQATEIMVMKPHAEKEIFGAPKFQIAKGTRRINISGRWCDMRADDLLYADESFHEPLIETALREGREEIGLRPHNIRQLYDLGGFTFISASKGNKKLMHLYAAEIIDPKNFGKFEETTSEASWMTAAEFNTKGREDHAAIVNEAVERLSKHTRGR